MRNQNLRIVITGDNSSTRFGGESILPYHYFRLLNQRGIDARLVTHVRCREEMVSLLPQYKDKMTFIEDNAFELWLYSLQVNRWLKKLEIFPLWVRHLIFQWKQRTAVKKLVAEKNISLVHQVIPVSPRLPSLICKVGAPVIIGPMNGGMEYPKNFEHLESYSDRLLCRYGRWWAPVMNTLLPGKKKAAMLLVANQRTQGALPVGKQVPVAYLVENGVDLTLWPEENNRTGDASRPVKFVYLGRLVPMKCVHYLVKAFQKISSEIHGELHIIGDGPQRSALTAMANGKDNIIFHGFINWHECPNHLKQCDVLVLPSMSECGGAVVLEGMMSQLPIIATAWGGPLDYLDSTCGILVEPVDEQQFIAKLADAMLKLAKSPELRLKMGQAGRKKAQSVFSWNKKIDDLLAFYNKVLT